MALHGDALHALHELLEAMRATLLLFISRSSRPREPCSRRLLLAVCLARHCDMDSRETGWGKGTCMYRRDARDGVGQCVMRPARG